MKQKLKKRPEFKEILLILGIAFFWNEMVYTGARQVAQSWYHYDLTTFIDQFVPFLPWTIVIYLGCFLFWAANYVLCAIQEKSERDRFFCADILAKGICFCFFCSNPHHKHSPRNHRRNNVGHIYEAALSS